MTASAIPEGIDHGLIDTAKTRRDETRHDLMIKKIRRRTSQLSTAPDQDDLSQASIIKRTPTTRKRLQNYKQRRGSRQVHQHEQLQRLLQLQKDYDSNHETRISFLTNYRDEAQHNYTAIAQEYASDGEGAYSVMSSLSGSLAQS